MSHQIILALEAKGRPPMPTRYRWASQRTECTKWGGPDIIWNEWGPDWTEACSWAQGNKRSWSDMVFQKDTRLLCQQAECPAEPYQSPEIHVSVENNLNPPHLKGCSQTFYTFPLWQHYETWTRTFCFFVLQIIPRLQTGWIDSFYCLWEQHLDMPITYVWLTYWFHLFT